jgi:hypothetical protein
MEESQEKIPVALEVDWITPGINTPVEYANNVIAQVTNSEVILSFYMLAPPPVLGTSEQQKQQYESVGKIQPRCVARIAVPFEQYPGFVEAMQTTLKNVKRREERKKTDDDAGGNDVAF